MLCSTSREATAQGRRWDLTGTSQNMHASEEEVQGFGIVSASAYRNSRFA